MLDQDVASYGVLNAHPPTDALDLNVEELTRRGFTLLDSGLDATELDRIRQDLDAVHTRQAAEGATLAADTDVARCLLAYADSFYALATNERLVTFCRRLLGDSFTLLQQNGISNRPTQEHYQLRWHRDLPFQHWVASKPIAVAALLCVDPFDETTGGTYALPGSQHHPDFPSEEFIRRHQEVVCAEPGTFVVMDAMLYHRAGRNVSDSVRRGVNHLVGLPFLGQQIALPTMLGGRGADDPFLAGYLGYRWGPAPSVDVWRQSRAGSA